jgi:hypothetical protein
MKSCGSTSLRSIGIVTFALGLTTAIFAPRNSGAHPMGNFSISHYAGIRVDSGWIEIRYILDMAEIPTFQEMQQAGIVAQPGDPGVAAYLAREAEVLKSGLALSLDGRPLALETVSESVIFPPGAGGLPTMKVGMLYRGLLPEGAESVHTDLSRRQLPGTSRMERGGSNSRARANIAFERSCDHFAEQRALQLPN